MDGIAICGIKCNRREVLMVSNYTIVIVKSGGWYAGYVKELPGAHSQGKTVKEVRENLKEAIRMIVDANRSNFFMENYE